MKSHFYVAATLRMARPALIKGDHITKTNQSSRLPGRKTVLFAKITAT